MGARFFEHADRHKAGVCMLQYKNIAAVNTFHTLSGFCDDYTPDDGPWKETLFDPETTYFYRPLFYLDGINLQVENESDKRREEIPEPVWVIVTSSRIDEVTKAAREIGLQLVVGQKGGT